MKDLGLIVLISSSVSIVVWSVCFTMFYHKGKNEQVR